MPQITETMEFEFQLPSTLIILVSFLVFLFLLLRSRSGTRNSRRIPGPRKLPIIGNLHNITGDSRLPHQIFRDLAAEYGPLMHLQLGEVPFVIVSSVEVAKQVLQTHDIAFANRSPTLASKTITYNFADIGMAPYGEYWRHLRKICTTELLSARRVKSFRRLREEVSLNMSKWIAANVGSPTNLSERLQLSAFDLITRASVGRTPDGGEAILSALKEALKISSGLSIADLYPSVKLLPLITGLKYKIEKIFQQCDTVLESIINQHRANKDYDDAMETDLVDVLLKYQEDGVELPLTTGSIKAVIVDMFTAGAETSANVVEWAMSEMIKNPTTLKRAQEEVRKVFDDKGFVDEEKIHELEYLKLVIKESMRLHPPLPLLLPRHNGERSEINGYEIPAKTTVLINAWALGRDPAYWNAPEKFIPERFTENNMSIDYKGNCLEYIPFGAGRRICPGMSFGMASVESILCMLLYHFDWEMPNEIKNEDLDMTEDVGITVQRKHHLLLIPTVRRPLATT